MTSELANITVKELVCRAFSKAYHDHRFYNTKERPLNTNIIDVNSFLGMIRLAYKDKGCMLVWFMPGLNYTCDIELTQAEAENILKHKLSLTPKIETKDTIFDISEMD